MAVSLNAANDGLRTEIMPINRRYDLEALMTACQQYANSEFEENIILLDTGHAKLMSAFFPLDILREISGFEDARYEDDPADRLWRGPRRGGGAPARCGCVSPEAETTRRRSGRSAAARCDPSQPLIHSGNRRRGFPGRRPSAPYETIRWFQQSP